MTTSRIVIGDVHGSYKTLLALISKLPKGVPITFVGDLIDRGPDSNSVVQYVMENGHDCVLANHEHMMLVALGLSKDQCYDPQLWYWNGADQTNHSYPDRKVFRQHLEWIATLPKYHEYPDVVNDKGQHLFVSHAAVMPFGPITNYNLDKACNLDVPNSMIEETIIWYRRTPAKLENRFHVFGHTPIAKAEITDYYACIDTGAVYKNRSAKLGRLTALRFPEMELFEQEYID